jgi:hypothetical protein
MNRRVHSRSQVCCSCGIHWDVGNRVSQGGPVEGRKSSIHELHAGWLDGIHKCGVRHRRPMLSEAHQEGRLQLFKVQSYV